MLESFNTHLLTNTPKGVIRIRKSKKGKQEMPKRKRNKKCNGQKKKGQTMQWSKEKRTNNAMVKRKRNKKCNGQKKKGQTMQWSKEKGTKRQ
jgi:hypothetical protein